MARQKKTAAAKPAAPAPAPVTGLEWRRTIGGALVLVARAADGTVTSVAYCDGTVPVLRPEEA